MGPKSSSVKHTLHFKPTKTLQIFTFNVKTKHQRHRTNCFTHQIIYPIKSSTLYIEVVITRRRIQMISPCLEGTLSPCTMLACFVNQQVPILSCPAIPVPQHHTNCKYVPIIVTHADRETQITKCFGHNLTVSGNPHTLCIGARVGYIQPSIKKTHHITWSISCT